MLVITGQVDLNLSALSLGLLQTQNVRLVFLEKRIESVFFSTRRECR